MKPAGPTDSSPCPICKRPAPQRARVAPFCSSRCQQIDLGNWLSEAYRVPGDPATAEESPPAPGNEER